MKLVTKEYIDTELTSKVDKLDRGNLLVGMNNAINIKGYKMLSITPSTPSESDATKYLQLDIEVNDKDLEEKAASSYATKDLVVIVASTHWVDAYAIYALSTNENGNSVISVRPYSVIGNKFTNTSVDNIALDSDASDTENWIYVDGKSFGTLVLRTQGATLTGEQNTSVGRYTFGSGRQNKVLDDGGVGVGRQNTVGYLAFAQGRGNKIYNGSAFGNSNIIEWNNSSVSFVTGLDNRIYRNSKGNLVSGHTNTLSSGTFNTVLGGNNSTNGTGSYNLLSGKFNLSQDGNHSGVVGTSNKIYSGDSNFTVGHDNHLRGNNNLCVGTSNDLFDTASNNILVGQNLSGKYPYQAIFGKLNQDDSNAVAVFAYPSDDKPNYSRNVTTIDKNGNIKALGDVTSNGVNITQQSNQLTNLMYAVLRNVGESATVTTVVTANARAGYSVVEGVEYISVAGAGNSKIGYVNVSEGDVIFIQSLTTLYGTTLTPPSVGWYLTDSCEGLTHSGVTNIKIIQKDDTSHGAGWITYSNVAIVVPVGANYLVFGYKNDTTPQIKILKTTLGDKIGDMDTALDNIIALQNSYIGGNA